MSVLYYGDPDPEVIKLFSMLNSNEHEISRHSVFYGVESWSRVMEWSIGVVWSQILEWQKFLQCQIHGAKFQLLIKKKLKY